ncbi:GTP 3',8-cyclase MoaA [Alteromonas sp. 14N.309.X.WAT.G.H12]|uniref:GTP 3',8-cyclase MoaA n=1 Tax=Alteromonas sp. 14N.309.X.WAT.G.H12 TaxID=3120824 RepID=UPI002FD713EF
MLQDTFGRRFHYLRLSVTDMCNFRCNYCLPDGGDCDSPKNYLTLPEIETLVAAFAHMGTRKVRITGGEPGLRKDLTEIINICKQTPGIEQIALTTNGFNLSKKSHEYVAAGLTSINVSADSLEPRMFASITGKDMLDRVMRGVEAIFEAGLTKVKFNTVLLRQYNTQAFAPFFTYLKHHPVTWRFIELMQTGDNARFFERNHFSGNALLTQLVSSGWTQIIRDKLAGPAQEFEHKEYQGRVGLIMPYSKDFCHSCNRLRVSSHGNLHLCLFAEKGFSLRSYLQQGDVQGTCDAVKALMNYKQGTHLLDQGFTGATKQLAMLGG